MKTALKYTAAWVAAVLFASVLGSIFSTQFVIAGLQSIGAEVSLSARLNMTVDDLAILQTLGLAIAAALLVGFVVAALLNRFAGGNRLFWFVIAGISAVTVLLMLMQWQLQLMPIAGARSDLGLAFQGFAGGCGGWLFSKLTKPIKPI